MILAPNEFAFVSDETKGEVNVYVGPNKTSLAGTDRPVVFDGNVKRFVATRDIASATQTFATAPIGWYVQLKNPAIGNPSNKGNRCPTGSGKLTTPELMVGKKVNIPGPVSFALWPGQMARIIQGHSLRSNEYLLVRVHDEAAAQENWNSAVLRANGDTSDSVDIPASGNLTMGRQFIIRGTDVSFYIPPTGCEVVPERVGNDERFVREAVTLERLEYCLLLDEDGNKRYVHGPAVVFPRPTEKFVEAPIKSNPDKAKAKKFRAQELTPSSGIHIRVIADYVEDDGTERKAGDELFITGSVQTIYYPRAEHAIVKYGEQDVHYGVAIPEGEARYVLNRETGVITLAKGPQIFLPDPRTQVIVQRALPLDLVSLMFPGNAAALEVNAQRLGIEDQDFVGACGGNAAFLSPSYNRSTTEDENYAATAAAVTPDTTRRIMIKAASKSLPGDSFDRKSKFTAPRSLVLNTKYDGAVTTTIWTGFAMLLVRKNGDRRVVQGPGTFMLEYDESPQVITLSTGKPKTTDNSFRTVFLQTNANLVSDIVDVETRDLVPCQLKLSYRVNFEGEPLQWFNVDNYVKYLTDHMRSRLRCEIKKMSVEEFYGNSADTIRDIVLGRKIVTADGKVHARPGAEFEENGMHVYDVEVLQVRMVDANVEKLLSSAQRESIQNNVSLQSEQRRLAYTQESERLKRMIETERTMTQQETMRLATENATLKAQLDLKVIDAAAAADSKRLKAEMDAKVMRLEIKQAEVNYDHSNKEALLLLDKKEQDLKLEGLKAESQSVIDKLTAITPDLVSALQAFGDKAMVERVAKSMAPFTLLGGSSAVDVIRKALAGTKFADVLGAAKSLKK